MGAAIRLGMDQGVWAREDLVLSTKIFFGCRSGPNDRGLSRKHFVEGARTSLQRMGVDYVDLIFCHRPDSGTPVEETVRAMNYVIDQGWALYWGLILAAKGGRADCLVPRAGHRAAAVPHLRALQGRKYTLGLTTWSSLNAGILSGKYNRGIPDTSRLATSRLCIKLLQGLEAKTAKVEQIQAIASELGATLAQFAIAWCAANERVSTVMLGASSVVQLEENLKAMEFLQLITPEIKAQVDAIVRYEPVLPPPMDAYVSSLRPIRD